ncbi:RHS repeat domain-containing protein [Chromobacterium violaceum]|uniref:RHS repeat domain-containing protein n=1 Tax=Chromobacterium violaceum TaxID=536 RepID=UPI0015F24B32|nr:RHS repeat protein [Chromobacterium violaceum]
MRELDYTAAGQKRREKTGNNVVTDYQYEAQTQRLQRVTTRRPSGNGAPQLQDLVYAYDPVGNILSVTDESKDVRYFANQAVAVESRYEYDALYQLVSATGRESVGGQDLGGQPPVWRPFPNDPSQLVNYEERYVYDRGGNLTDLHHRGAGNYHRHMTVGEGSNRAQLGYEGGDVETGFDACGNLRRLSPGGQRLQWDGRNQLREVVLVERTENASDREVYQYGGDGMRVRKERSRLASGVNGREEVIYLPGLELRTRYAGEEAREAWAVIVSDTARVLHWEKGKPDGLANDSIRYSLDNHLGSSVMELDGDGKLITAEEYYPYGGTACWLAKSEVEAKYKTVRYSGKERDETGLYDYGYRYYAPWLGRWLNPDPAGTVDGINIFCFVCGNPTSAYDLDGDILYHFVDSRDIDLDRQDPRGAGYNPQQQRRHAKVAVNFEFPTLKAGGSVDFYLKRTRPGNLFTGIVDVDSGEVNLHPLNINRIGEGGPSQNDGWKKNYAGEFYEGHGALIEHNPSAGLGMTSHEQAAKIFKKNKFTSIGFSFYDVRGLRSMGDSLGREESKNTSALYGRSRSLNRPHMYRVPDSMKPGGSNIESFRAAEREYNPTKLKGDIEKGREVVEPFFELPIEFKVKILDLLRGCVEDSHLSRVLRDEMERPEYLIETYGKLKNKKNNTVVHNPAYANFRF